MKPSRDDTLFEQLSAYLDGELSDAERGEVEAWLARDEAARQTLAELRRAADLLHGLPRGTAPPDLVEAVTAQIERRELLGGPESVPEPAPRRMSGTVGRWLATAAVIALSATAGILTFSYLRREPPAPRPSPVGPVAFRDENDKNELTTGDRDRTRHGGSTPHSDASYPSLMDSQNKVADGGARSLSKGSPSGDELAGAKREGRWLDDEAARRLTETKENYALNGVTADQGAKAASSPDVRGHETLDAYAGGGGLDDAEARITNGNLPAGGGHSGWRLTDGDTVHDVDGEGVSAGRGEGGPRPSPGVPPTVVPAIGDLQLELAFADSGARDEAAAKLGALLTAPTRSPMVTEGGAYSPATASARAKESGHPPVSDVVIVRRGGSRVETGRLYGAPGQVRTVEDVIDRLERAELKPASVRLEAGDRVAVGWEAARQLGRQVVEGPVAGRERRVSDARDGLVNEGEVMSAGEHLADLGYLAGAGTSRTAAPSTGLDQSGQFMGKAAPPSPATRPGRSLAAVAQDRADMDRAYGHMEARWQEQGVRGVAAEPQGNVALRAAGPPQEAMPRERTAAPTTPPSEIDAHMALRTDQHGEFATMQRRGESVEGEQVAQAAGPSHRRLFIVLRTVGEEHGAATPALGKALDGPPAAQSFFLRQFNVGRHAEWSFGQPRGRTATTCLGVTTQPATATEITQPANASVDAGEKAESPAVPVEAADATQPTSAPAAPQTGD